MTRLNPDTTPCRVPIDVATTTNVAMSIDPTLIGAFDQALRQVGRSEYEENLNQADSSPETSRRIDQRPAELNRRETDEKYDSATDDGASASRASEDTSADTRETSPDEAPRTDSAADGQEVPDGEDDASASTKENAEDASIVVETVAAPTELSTEATRQETGEDGQPVVGQKSAETKTSAATNTESAVDSAANETPADEMRPAVQLREEAIVAVEGDAEADSKQGSEKDTVAAERQSLEKARETLAKQATDQATDVGQDQTDGEKTTEPTGETRQGSTPDDGSRHDSSTRRDNANHDLVSRAQQAKPAHAEPTTSVQPAGETGPRGDLEAAIAGRAAESATTETTSAEARPQGTAATEAIQAATKGTVTTDKPVPARSASPTAGEGVDRARFVGRVTKAFAAMGQRDGAVRLKLHPRELGSLRIEITVKNGMLSARLEAETVAARNLLVEGLPALRERLAEQGIKVEQFDVDLSDHAERGPSQRPDDDASTSQPTPRERNAGSETDSEEQAADIDPTTRHIRDDSRLDVVI